MATSKPLVGNFSGFEYDTAFMFENVSDTLESGFGALCVNNTVNGSDFNCTSGEVTSLDEQNLWALLLLFFPIFTVFGNILVILAVFRERSLKSATNYFIVSLAVADCLVATTAMPFAVYVQMVNGTWSLPAIMCDFYIAMDVICSTSSIFNLVAISIDRFIAITRPISYARHRDNRRVYLTIGLVWIISIAIGIPVMLGLNESPERVQSLCIFYNADFILYSSLSSFYIPCIIMVFLYYRIFKVLRQRAIRAVAKSKRNHPAEMGPPTVIENKSSLHLPSAESHSVTNGKKMPEEEEQDEDEDNGAEDEGSEEHVPNGVSTECFVPAAASIVVLTTSDLQHQGTGLSASPNKSSGDSGNLENQKAEAPNHKNNLWNYLTKTSSEREGEANSYLPPNYEKSVVQNGPRFTICRARKASRKKREKTSAKRERKATKTLAIVLVVFLACWVPFFTCNIMDALCTKLNEDCSPGMMAFLVTTWLGYINSSLNPVIYTIFNMEFRKAFKRILYTCE